MTACAAPIEFEALIAYWLGELPPALEAPLEEHLFGCAHCTRRLEALAALASGIRAAVRDGAVHAVATGALVESMKKQGLRLREYRLAPGGRVACTIRADDDAVISRLQAPLAGVTRLDAVQSIDETNLEVRIADIPFDAAAGEVVLLPSAAALKKMPAHTQRIRLLAVEQGQEREIGEYTFVHTPG